MIGFFVLSLMSKPMLVTFPFLLLLLDLWPLQRLSFGRWRLRWSARQNHGPFDGFCWKRCRCSRCLDLRRHSHRFTARGQACSVWMISPLGSRLANAIVGYTFYLEKLAAPFKLAFFYPHPGHWPLSVVALSAVFRWSSLLSPSCIVASIPGCWLAGCGSSACLFLSSAGSGGLASQSPTDTPTCHPLAFSS